MSAARAASGASWRRDPAKGPGATGGPDRSAARPSRRSVDRGPGESEAEGGTSMFVQVFQGPVSDPAQVKKVLDRWVVELGPTRRRLAGQHGRRHRRRLVHRASPRFDSRGAQPAATATAPSRVSGGHELEKLFTSEPAFHESTDSRRGRARRPRLGRLRPGDAGAHQRRRSGPRADGRRRPGVAGLPTRRARQPDGRARRGRVDDGDLLHQRGRRPRRASRRSRRSRSARRWPSWTRSPSARRPTLDLRDPWLASPS